MDYNEYELSKKEEVLFALCLLLFFGGCGFIFYASFLPAFLAPLFYRPMKVAYRQAAAEKRKNQLLMEFRDFLYSLSSSFASGRHMQEAMEEGMESLHEIYSEKGILENEISQMLAKIRETGEADIDLWNDFAKRSHLEDIQDFTAVYGACRKTGGSLVLAVNKAAAVIGEKISIEREIKLMASQKKLEGRMITALPVIIVLFLQIMSPEYLEVMYTTFAGRILMTMALVLAMGAYVVIEKITRIEV